jgi:hypothetical protein
MNTLYPPEVVPAPGHGWTVVRGGMDQRGGFECWIGRSFAEHRQAEAAATAWEEREPSVLEEEEP